MNNTRFFLHTQNILSRSEKKDKITREKTHTIKTYCGRVFHAAGQPRTGPRQPTRNTQHPLAGAFESVVVVVVERECDETPRRCRRRRCRRKKSSFLRARPARAAASESGEKNGIVAAAVVTAYADTRGKHALTEWARVRVAFGSKLCARHASKYDSIPQCAVCMIEFDL